MDYQIIIYKSCGNYCKIQLFSPNSLHRENTLILLKFDASCPHTKKRFQHLHFLALSQEFLLEVEGRTEIKLSKLLAAMTVMGNGIRMGQVDMEAIYQGYKLAFPENAQELDEWMLGEDEYAEW